MRITGAHQTHGTFRKRVEAGVQQIVSGLTEDGNLPPRESSSVDSHYATRVALILLGLSAPGVAVWELLRGHRQIRADLGVTPILALFLAGAVIGWRDYPYWVNGVYQVDLGAFPGRDQDPKGLMPMVWIGDLWRIPVLFLHLTYFAGVPLLAIAGIIALWKRRLAVALITALGFGTAVVFMHCFSRDYVGWLMD